MGFSPLGLIVALAVLAPNALLLWLPPRGGFPPVRLPGILSWLERAGQALCLVIPVITEPGPQRWQWAAVVVGIGLVGYYALWARYLAAGRTSALLYAAAWKVPVPMAILPVVIFAATGAWLGNLWVIGSALVLAAGHIPASLLIARAAAPS
ncbi:hypothetical protein NQ152_10320 [Microbacterium sp. zg.B48]|uniref:hypothetical protein n=1 Tax=Microbacterium sp. zg.B48 TaxID=2969408 RepID=UPI00214CA702|nr:hypothetical protein [Microbacterium sp. zg.B48]MCR2763898.1 hypothetical protein [Microbacterium sp. zg.B48]